LSFFFSLPFFLLERFEEIGEIDPGGKERGEAMKKETRFHRSTSPPISKEKKRRYAEEGLKVTSKEGEEPSSEMLNNSRALCLHA
jgi:hypothetical protein